MNIRSFQLSDHYPLTQLLQGMLSDGCYQDTIKALANQLSWDHELVLLAESQKKIVGCIIGTIDQEEGYFYRIAVDPQYQRVGIGRSLLRALTTKFHQRNVKRMRISIDQHNEILIPFYQALGYEPSDFTRAYQQLSITQHA